MATVDLRGVRKTYPGGAEAVRGIDLAVADGEVLVILGPSGCGKSTLLRMVAGLERITAGEVLIGGRAVNRLEPKDRDIAMVFQSYALYPHMTVYDNMAYGLRMRGLPRAAIDRRVRETAAVLELSDHLGRKPRQLSGGQRQRVAMGRAIVREPAVFLFDEPLSNLDARLRTQMRVEIRRLQQRLGTTSLYVTHDQIEAMTLADRMLVMKDGGAEQIGTPLDIYRTPASLFVAGFLGAPPMNLLTGRVTGDGRAVALAGGGAVLATAQAAGHAGRPVVIGIRPEHLCLAGAAEGGTRLMLRVDLVEALGADTVVHGRVDGGGETVLARLPGGCRAAPGDHLPPWLPTRRSFTCSIQEPAGGYQPRGDGCPRRAGQRRTGPGSAAHRAPPLPTRSWAFVSRTSAIRSRFPAAAHRSQAVPPGGKPPDDGAGRRLPVDGHAAGAKQAATRNPSKVLQNLTAIRFSINTLYLVSLTMFHPVDRYSRDVQSLGKYK